MVAERRGSSPWHWAFYSSSSFCYMRLRFESTRPKCHGFTITPRVVTDGYSLVNGAVRKTPDICHREWPGLQRLKIERVPSHMPDKSGIGAVSAAAADEAKLDDE